ncbi:glycosyl transferase family 2 [Paenibacillus curdlanolyticus YK9]|uniref:Glycosyl transferase family 2 n=1 Tax=Paenibacillus curdlanolyticus YK9 TaxID=717606 RepID=E0IET9_9BACL|nr:glycosyltransferase family 2 protein [Paenibacillus curdlanolyticus]EFM09177.1 glycosyl transferase family 2 [Paenibacillus curdlanolyticus YK9]
MELRESPGVSLCMIVRNEEAFIEECLASAAPYVSEMLVCDTGSTDRTMEIAHACGARVVSIPWDDDFAAARNLSLELAAHPWILVLDADERLEAPEPSQWRELLCDETAAGYYVRLISVLERTGGEQGSGTLVTDAVCRLFRNDAQIRFSGIIHEECATAVALAQRGPVAIAPVTVRHEGYRANVIEERRKPERNARLLAKALAKEPDNIMLRYAAGTELFGAGRWLEAIEWLAPLAEGEGLGETCGFASDVRLKLSHAYRLAGQLEAAIAHAEAGVREYPDFPDMCEALAAAYMARDDAPSALRALEQAIAIGPAAPYYSSVAGAGGFRSHYAAGASCERLYRWREAAAHYRAALGEHPAYEAAEMRLRLLACGEAGLMVKMARAMALRAAGAESDVGSPAGLYDLLLPNALAAARHLKATTATQALAVGLRASEAGRWAEAAEHFAVARSVAASPVQARAAAAGLAAAFAARAAAALEAPVTRAEGRGAKAGLPRCFAELRLIVLAAIYEP